MTAKANTKLSLLRSLVSTGRLTSLVALFAGIALSASDIRVPVDATINGEHVQLIFDTATTELTLFRSTAERLKLKISQRDPDLRPPPGMVVGSITEPCTLVFQGNTLNVQFAVFDLPSSVRTQIEGFLPWYPFRKKVLIVDSAQKFVALTNNVPSYAKNWRQFELLNNSRVLGFTMSGANPYHNTIYVDMGDPGGLNLNTTLWKKWKAKQGEYRSTLTASYLPATGLTVSEELWADVFTLGPLTIEQIPIQEQIAAYTDTLMPNHAATLGMFALRRVDLVVDGANGIVYARATDKPPPQYSHNRLGAVFVPEDLERAALSLRELLQTARHSWPEFERMIFC